jgi:hypothetical protein
MIAPRTAFLMNALAPIPTVKFNCCHTTYPLIFSPIVKFVKSVQLDANWNTVQVSAPNGNAAASATDLTLAKDGDPERAHCSMSN